MDRIDDAYTTAKRAEVFAEADPNNTSGPLRSDRSDLGALKDSDDVTVGGIQARVICPGEALGWFYAWTWDLFDPNKIVLGQYEAQYVTDRAPVDPEETPMPIFPEPESP